MRGCLLLDARINAMHQLMFLVFVRRMCPKKWTMPAARGIQQLVQSGIKDMCSKSNSSKWQCYSTKYIHTKM